MSNGVRTWPDDGHPAGKHVDELRQLIERGTAQEVAHTGDARIVLRRLGHHLVILHHLHGAEFPHHDRLTVHAVAGLTEDDRPRRAELHRQRNAAQHRGDEQQDQRRKHDIFHALQHAVNPRQWRVVQRNNRYAVHFFNAGMEDVEGKDIRDEDHRAGGIRQLAHQFLDAGFIFHLHGDIDVVDLPCFRVVNKLFVVTCPVGRHAAGLRVVINPDHFKT